MIGTNSTIGSLSNPDILSSVFGVLPPEVSSKLSTLLDISSLALIIFIIYIGVLIVFKILSIRDSRNLKKIRENAEEINKKLDFLIRKKRK